MDSKNIKNEEVIFETHNIFKSIRNKILLDNVSFKLFKKSFHVIIGHNGAGKSTLFNICSGNDKKYTGDIYFKNQNINLVKTKKVFCTLIRIFHFLLDETY